MIFFLKFMKSSSKNIGNRSKFFIIDGYNICTHRISKTISIRDYKKIKINDFENHFPLKMSVILEVKIKKKCREEIITFLWNFI